MHCLRPRSFLRKLLSGARSKISQISECKIQTKIPGPSHSHGEGVEKITLDFGPLTQIYSFHVLILEC